MSVRILMGDALAMLKTLPDESVQCCVTSPPYFGLRDYGVAGQLGLEATPDAYVAGMVAVFHEVRRVLKSDGVLWLNIGDSYASDSKWGGRSGGKHVKELHGDSGIGRRRRETGLKDKDLIGIPWMLAFALRSDGWWLRGEQIWAKRNGMPGSQNDRPTRSHETVFLLSKSASYFYDGAAVRTPPAPSSDLRLAQDVDAQEGSHRANGGAKTNGTMKAVRRSNKQRGHSRTHAGFNDRWDAMSREEQMANGSTLRSVWWIATEANKEAHFAIMPRAVARVCILAGSRKGDTVLDPFGGAGTTGLVADRLGRNAILCELNPEYAAMAERRIKGDAGMFADVGVA